MLGLQALSAAPANTLRRPPLFEDDIWRRPPDERFRLVVPTGQPREDGALKFLDAMKGPSANHAIREESRLALYLIHPGTRVLSESELLRTDIGLRAQR